MRARRVREPVVYTDWPSDTTDSEDIIPNGRKASMKDGSSPVNIDPVDDSNDRWESPLIPCLSLDEGSLGEPLDLASTPGVIH